MVCRMRINEIVCYGNRFECYAMRFECDALRFECYPMRFIWYDMVYVVKEMLEMNQDHPNSERIVSSVHHILLSC